MQSQPPSRKLPTCSTMNGCLKEASSFEPFWVLFRMFAYAFYKQATEGDVREAENPYGAWVSMDKHYGWSAWQCLQGLPRQQAMSCYVKYVENQRQLFPRFAAGEFATMPDDQKDELFWRFFAANLPQPIFAKCRRYGEANKQTQCTIS